MRLEHRVTELLTDDGAVVGVRAESPAGPVEARGPVVLATSTYDWDPELVQEMVGLTPEDFGSVAPGTIRGDGIRLARAVGGPSRTAGHGDPDAAGLADRDRVGYAYGPDYAMPHSMIVDRPATGTATTPTGSTSSRRPWTRPTGTCRSSSSSTSSTTRSTAWAPRRPAGSTRPDW